jgi:ubiquinone/menaquinone biosynthesis C-methylase UbiE
MSDIAYLDRAAASNPGAAYKARVLSLLNPTEGQVALDIGCGPGTDLGPVVDAVGSNGRVIGVDHDPTMLAEAARRHPSADLRAGDAHQLPVDPSSVDRIRIDRVLQHLTDAAAALREVARVLRPGGLVALADNDWDTLVIDGSDLGTSRAYTAYVSTRVVRNATIGRQLARLAHNAGLTVRAVEAIPVVFTNYADADAIFKFEAVAGRAVADGALASGSAQAWLTDLRTAPTFLTALTFFIVVAEA